MRFRYLLPCLFSPVFSMAESSIVKAFENAALHGQIKLFSYDIDLGLILHSRYVMKLWSIKMIKVMQVI